MARRWGKKRLACLDCGVNTSEIGEFYMVRSDVWTRAVKRDLRRADLTWGTLACAGCLCIGCLEARLGRLLCRDDFTDVELNTREEFRSPRLRDRLRRVGPPRPLP